MGGDGVSNDSAGAGEGVGRMVNGTGLTSGSIARSSGGWRLVSTMIWQRLGVFRTGSQGTFVQGGP